MNDREKFIMFAVAMHGLLTDNNEDEFFKKLYAAAAFYLPNTTHEQMVKIYIDEIQPEFDHLLKNSEAFTLNRKKKAWAGP